MFEAGERVVRRAALGLVALSLGCAKPRPVPPQMSPVYRNERVYRGLNDWPEMDISGPKPQAGKPLPVDVGLMFEPYIGAIFVTGTGETRVASSGSLRQPDYQPRARDLRLMLVPTAGLNRLFVAVSNVPMADDRLRAWAQSHPEKPVAPPDGLDAWGYEILELDAGK
ncbi:MAG: hypothetical protein ACYCWW_03920 [Deltaproteobacteria bacterium]